MANYSSYKHIITAGIFAATLSSALACLVSAPKIFQALCKDEIFPYIGYFAKGYGPNEDPRRAYVLCFFVSIAFILIGDLNTIAPIISNFFLASYCLINYSCFMASLSKTPGWRPGFKYYNKWLSLFGAVVCFIIMFVMSWIAGLITIAITFGLYLLIHFKQKEFDVTNNPQAINWGSSSLSYIEALNSTQKLEQVRTHVKNFRPGTLALVGDPRDRPALAYLAGSITKDTSLMICGNFIDTASVVPNAANKEEASQPENPYLIDTKAKAIKSWFQEKNIKSFYTTFFGNNFFQAANGLIQTAGVGGLKPNTLLMGFKSDWKTDKSENVKNYIDVIQRAFICKYGVGLLRMPKGIDEIAQDESMNLKDGDMMKNAREAAANMYFNPNPTKKDAKRKRIDVWWLVDDGGLCILVAHLLQQSPSFKDAKIRILTGAGKGGDVDNRQRRMKALMGKFRISFESIEIVSELSDHPGADDKTAYLKEIKPFGNNWDESVTEKVTVLNEKDNDVFEADTGNAGLVMGNIEGKDDKNANQTTKFTKTEIIDKNLIGKLKVVCPL